MKKPDQPLHVRSYDDAARLCANWPGVYKARRKIMVNGDVIRDVIAVSFWPWVRHRKELMAAMVSEITSRSVVEFPVCLLRARQYRRLQGAYDTLQKEKDTFYAESDNVQI